MNILTKLGYKDLPERNAIIIGRNEYVDCEQNRRELQPLLIDLGTVRRPTARSHASYFGPMRLIHTESDELTIAEDGGNQCHI